MDSNLPDTFDIEGFNSYLQLLLQVDDIQTDGEKTSATGVREYAYEYFAKLDWDILPKETLKAYLNIFNIIHDKIAENIDKGQAKWIEVLLGFLDNYSLNTGLPVFETVSDAYSDLEDDEIYDPDSNDLMQKATSIIFFVGENNYFSDVEKVSLIDMMIAQTIGNLYIVNILTSISTKLLESIQSGQIEESYYAELISQAIAENQVEFELLMKKFRDSQDLIEFILNVFSLFTTPGYAPEVEMSLVSQIKADSDTNKLIDLRQFSKMHHLTSKEIPILITLMKQVFNKNILDAAEYFKTLLWKNFSELISDDASIDPNTILLLEERTNTTIIDLLVEKITNYLDSSGRLKLYNSFESVLDAFRDLESILTIEETLQESLLTESFVKILRRRISEANTIPTFDNELRVILDKDVSVKVLEILEQKLYNLVEYDDRLDSVDGIGENSVDFASLLNELHLALGEKKKDLDSYLEIVEDSIVEVVEKKCGHNDLEQVVKGIIHPIYFMIKKLEKGETYTVSEALVNWGDKF